MEQEQSLAAGLREALTIWGEAVRGVMIRNNGVMAYNDAWSAALTKSMQGLHTPKNKK